MPGSTAATRYGQQGNRWLPDDATAPKAPKIVHARKRCAQCGEDFLYAVTSETDEGPATCGRHACHARQSWTPEEWAGLADMAHARQAAGAPLTRLDEEALERTGGV